jgi:phospholipase/lecithinase/hemolysin
MACYRGKFVVQEIGGGVSCWDQVPARIGGNQNRPSLKIDAFGGACVTIPGNAPDSIPPSAPPQVYVIEGGGNDILVAITANNLSVEPLAFQIALGISESELALRRAGARHFLIPDLLDVGQLPAAKANAGFASSASVATNNALGFFLGSEGLFEGIHIYRINVFSLFHDVAQDVTHFGFTDITDPCLTPVPNPPFYSVCSNPFVALFWDAEHPTEFGHAFFAVTVEANLGPKP